MSERATVFARACSGYSDPHHTRPGGRATRVTMGDLPVTHFK